MKDLIDLFRGKADGKRAHELLKELTKYHRIQVTKGYDEALYFLKGYLEEYGIKAIVEEFEAGKKYWGYKTPTGWKAARAELWLDGEKGPVEKLADFTENPLSLIQRSYFKGELRSLDFEVVEKGESPEDYRGIALENKLVLTRGAPWRVRDLAVDKFGALGLLYYGVMDVEGLDRSSLREVRNYTAFWPTGGEKREAFGFALTAAQGEKLKELRGKARLSLKIDADYEHLDILDLYGKIQGDVDDEIILIAHLCHPRPGANDNASGAVSLVEAIRLLKKLIDEGTLKRPKRSISFLLVPEFTGSFAFLDRYYRKKRIVAGLNLDMVGEDQEKTGSTLRVIGLPVQLGGFEDALLYEILLNVSLNRGLKTCFSDFQGGSDHALFSDPTVGIPMPHLFQWPDLYYHTDHDTPEMVSPESLEVSIIIASTYLYYLATAGDSDYRDLESMFLKHLPERIEDHLKRLKGSEPPPSKEALNDYFLEYAKRSYYRALKSLGMKAKRGKRKNFLKMASVVIGDRLKNYEKHESLPFGWSSEVYRRLKRGPHFLRQRRHELSERDREELSQFILKRNRIRAANSLFFWMDGKRSLNEIARYLVSEGLFYRDDLEKILDISLKLGEIDRVSL